MHVDTPNRKLSLGVKQLQPDHWETFFSCHLAGDEVTGNVTRMTNFGAFVELAPAVEGLCHSSEIPGRASAGKQSRLKVGQVYRFKVVKLDEFGKKIGLSRRGVVDDAPDHEAPNLEAAHEAAHEAPNHEAAPEEGKPPLADASPADDGRELPA
jgi:small subunit ribosomal protein S1